jgi:hypothetical protein
MSRERHDRVEARRVIEQMQIVQDQDDVVVHPRQSRSQAGYDRSLDRGARRRQRAEQALIEARHAVERDRDIRQENDRIVVLSSTETHANGRCDLEAH